MTFERFTQLVSDISRVPSSRIQVESAFRDDLGIDSLQMVNLITHCFDSFGVGVEVIESQDDLKSVGSLYLALSRGKANV